MKKLISLVLSLSIITSCMYGFSVFADDWNEFVPDDINGIKCGENVSMNMSTTGVLTISGTGDMYNYDHHNNNYSPIYCVCCREIVIESGVTSVGDSFFYHIPGMMHVSGYYYDSIEKISIAEGVTRIGKHAFREARMDETEITIPSTVKTIDDYAFELSFLKKISLLGSPEVIGKYAFAATNITEFFIPASVESIGRAAYASTPLLERLDVSEENKFYKSVSGCLIEKQSGTIIASTNNCIIPSDENIKSIGVRAFDSRLNLEDVVIPEGVNQIEPYAFYTCKNLKSVYLPNSVNVIDAGAFINCASLENINIPKSVTSIADDAFENCRKLTIYCDNMSEARKFAQLHGIKYVIISGDCDFDNDGTTSVADALSALRIAAKLANPLERDGMLIGDMDEDGDITVADALVILRIAAKLD